jgi:hypothetical protein
MNKLRVSLFAALVAALPLLATSAPVPRPVPGVPSLGARAAALATVTCVAGTGTTLSATLTITPPTTDSNGNPLTLPITGYNIYQGAQGAEAKVATVTTTVVTVTTGLLPGASTYWFATALDANGEGLHSAEGCKSFPASTAPPGAPGLAIS